MMACDNGRQHSINEALPGFATFNAFFASLGKEYRPEVVGSERKCQLIGTLKQISGWPISHVAATLRDWRESAIVREVRTYGSGVRMVRLEVRRRPGRNPNKPLEKDPIILLLALDGSDRLLRYTFLYGTGRHEAGVKAFLLRQHGEKKEIDTTSFARVYDFVRTMEPADIICLCDGKYDNQFVDAECICVKQGRRLFSVGYGLRNFAWQFDLPELVSREELERLLRVYETSGIRGLQEATEWVQSYSCW